MLRKKESPARSSSLRGHRVGHISWSGRANSPDNTNYLKKILGFLFIRGDYSAESAARATQFRSAVDQTTFATAYDDGEDNG